MKHVTLLFCLLFSVGAWALDKNALDLHESRDELKKSASLNGTAHFGHRFLATEFLEASLMTGGAFTLGVNKGTDTPFDDQAPLSFGHPYALTSYPLLRLDGEWRRLDQWFTDWEAIAPQTAGGRLLVEATLQGVRMVFALEATAGGRALVATLSAKNLDAAAHRLGWALVYDPALGHGGDGFVRMNGQALNAPAAVTSSSALQNMIIAERAKSPFGLQLKLSCETPPDRALFDNWPHIYSENALTQPQNTNAPFFDLCLKLLWDDKPLAPGEERSARVRFELMPPEFAGALMRWDLPSALTLENNLLFPRRVMTGVRVMNTGAGALNNLQLAVSYPKELFGTESTTAFAVAAGASAYPVLEVNSKEIYEDKIVPVKLTLHLGAEVLDELVRYVFIPATPVSAVGLTVTIDSAAVDKHPQVSLVMRAAVTETGVKLLNLTTENVFLYENDRRVEEFELKKFAAGGAAMADVCFVLDISGSMGDEIHQVRNYLGEFADSLARRGFDYRIAVVAFSTTVDERWTRDFTKDIEAIKRNLAGIILWGGIEDSPGAMQYALDRFSWRPGSKRTIIWVTDEPYPENIQKRDPLINALLANGVTVHGVGLLELQTDWFNPIVLPTGGNFYNIAGNFRDILLDVARMRLEDRYLISYTSRVSRSELKLLSVQVRYAGLGGQAQFQLGGKGAGQLVCFPNPFNPTVTLRAFGGENGVLQIYNLLGQCVRSFALPRGMTADVLWDATDERGLPVSAGLYVVTLTHSHAGVAVQQQQRILYLR